MMNPAKSETFRNFTILNKALLFLILVGYFDISGGMQKVIYHKTKQYPILTSLVKYVQ